MKQAVRLSETNLERMISESIRKVLNESGGSYDSVDDYWESFYKNVYEANEALYRALSFCGDDMKSDYLVKQIKKAFKITNEVAYYIGERKKKG